MKKRIYYKIIAAVMGFSLMMQPLASYAVTDKIIMTEDEDGDAADAAVSEDAAAEETEQVITISDAEELVEFAESCHVDTYSLGLKVVLTQDIMLTGSEFHGIPIFSGHFDGAGHSISGYRYGGDGYVTGFFRYLSEEASVENLTLNITINAEGKQSVTGGIAGINRGRIENCVVNGRIKGKNDTGGLVGINEASGQIISCVNNAELSGFYCTGGLAGKNYGLISKCTNNGNINDSVEWVEEDDEMGGDILSGLTDAESVSDVRLRSGIDTGGIAGYSKGVILGCTNEAIIGYEHAGYNVGGIAGRQCGSMNGCTNNGSVYGRKDVGGIVGQMEPYLEISDKDSIKKAIDELHDMVNATLNMMDANNEVLRLDMDNLQRYADAAADTGTDMTNSASDYVSANTDVVNDASSRSSDIIDMMPKVVDNVSAAGDKAEDLAETLRQTNEDLHISGRMSDADKERADAYVDDMERQSQIIQTSSAQLKTDSDALASMADTDRQNGTIPNEADYFDLIADMGTQMSNTLAAIGQSESDLSALYDIYDGYVKDAADDTSKNVEKAIDEMDDTAKSLDEAQEGVSDITSYLNAQSDLQLVQIDRSWDVQVNELHSELSGMSDSVNRLSDHAGDYSAEVNDNLRAINDQINKIYSMADERVTELTDHGFDDIYTDVSDLSILTATLGKVASCANYGEVRGDINIGGITGAMALDEDDPESNAAGSVEFSIGQKYTSQNILHNCTNRGYVTAKGDGVGCIVGYMSLGVVDKAYAYGVAESVGGNYVGGIAGQSMSTIQNSYVLCAIAGGEYVGGVAGYGRTITDCYAMPTISRYTGKSGAIAGQIEIEEDTEEPHLESVVNNRYVSDVFYGIDGISYGGSAEDMSYSDLIRTPGLPIEYRFLTVTFRVDDTYLGAQQIAYGESFDSIEYPEIPYKPGYYGVWPEPEGESIQGNLVITAEYIDSVRVLASGNIDTESGKVLGYVDNEFNDTAGLLVQQTHEIPFTGDPLAAESVVYQVDLVDMPNGSAADYSLRLYNPFEGEHKVWYYNGDAWSEAEFIDRGTYVQVTMHGFNGVYAIEKPSMDKALLRTLILLAMALVLIVLLVIVHKKGKKKQSETKKEKKDKKGKKKK